MRATGNQAPAKGKDYEAHLTINLQAAFEGSETMIEVNGSTIKVNIPKGVRDGQVLRVKGKGEKGTGGRESGHLYLKIIVEPDKHFERKEMICILTLKSRYIQPSSEENDNQYTERRGHDNSSRKRPRMIWSSG